MLPSRISSLVKRKEAWRRAFNWLSHQDCSITGSHCPPAFRPDMLASYGADSHVFQRAHLHQLASPVVQASPSLDPVNESATLSDEATPGLKTAAKENVRGRREMRGKFVKEDGLRKIVNDLILASRYRDEYNVRIAMAQLRAFQGHMDYPTLHSVMAEFRMQPGSSQIAEDFMKLMAKKGVVMEEGSYTCFLLSLCKEDKILRAFEVLTDLGKAADEDVRGVVPKPSVILANVVLAAAHRLNNKEIFYKTMDFIKQRKLQPQSITHLQTIKMAGSKQSLSELREAWAAAMADVPPHLPIPLHYVRVLIVSRLGSLPEALIAFDEMKEAMRFYGWDPERQRSEGTEGVWLNHPPSSLSEEESSEASEDGHVAGRGWDVSSSLKVVYTSLMNGATSEGNAKALLNLLEEAKELGIEAFSEEVLSNMMLCTAANSGNLSEAERMAGSMMERGIAIQPNSYTNWIEACCKVEDRTAAENLLVEAVSNKAAEIAMFGPLIDVYIRKTDNRGGQWIANMMKEARLEPSAAYYAALLGLVGLVGRQAAEEAVRGRLWAILLEKNSKKIFHSCASFHAMVWAFGRAGFMSEVIQQFRWARGLKQQPGIPLTNVLVYNTAIHACLRLGKLAEFKELMQMLEKDNLKLDLSVDRALRREASYGNSGLKSANKVLDALPSIEREPDLTTFNFLIQVMCQDDRLDAGMTLLQRMVDQGVPRDRNTYLHLLGCATRRAEFKPIKKLVAEMHREGFAADVDTCMALMALHVQHGKYAGGVHMLNKLVHRIRETPGAVESGSETLFAKLEKWVMKEKERDLASNNGNKDNAPLRDVEEKKGGVSNSDAII